MIKLFGLSLGRDKEQKNSGIKKSIWNDPSFSDIVRKSGSFKTQKEQLNAYGDVGWVAIAIDCICNDIGSRDYFFTDRDGNVIDNVPENILLPFENGYGNLTFQQMNAITTAHKLLTGNALLLKMKSTAYGLYKGIDETFAFIPPSNFKVITKPSGLQLDHYEITFADNTIMNATPEQVIHLSQNNLKSAFVGMGNIEKIRLTVEGELYSDEFNNEFMARKASPSLAVIDKGSITDAEFEKTKDILRQEYEGRNNSGKILYLAGSEISVNELGMSQKDIQFIEKKQWDRQTILSIFRVPPVRAGIPDNSNRATSDQQMSQYYKDINNLLRINADMITKQFIRPISPDINLNFTLFSTGEIDYVVKQVQAGLISPNRGSELIGETPDYENETLDRRYMPSNLIEVGTVANAPSFAPVDPNAPVKCSCGAHSKKKSIDDPKNVDEIVDYWYGDKGLRKEKSHQAQFLRTALNSRLRIETKYFPEFAKFFAGQKERVLKAFNDRFKSDKSKATKAEIDENSYRMIFDLESEDEILSGEAKRIHTSAVQSSIMDMNRLMNGGVEFSLTNPFVKNAIRKLGDHLVNDLVLNGNTQDQLKELIIKGIGESWNINEYQKAITEKFEMFEGYRARMIARTESRAGYDAGSQIAYKELDVKTVDIVGCTQFEPDSDCGATDVPVDEIDNLTFHPNHIGCPAPSAVS